MRFQDAVPDGRAVVYAAIQSEPHVAHVAELLAGASTAERLLARAVMNGERADPEVWRRMFPALFGVRADPTTRDRSEAILLASLEVAERGEQVRSQVRGAIVESLAARLLAARAAGAVRRERRILFDGVAAEIHPYDVTVEQSGSPEAWDCKWGARGINADVLYQLHDALTHAEDEEQRLAVGLVIFDAELSCLVRLSGQSAPQDGLQLVAIEALDRLRRPPAG